MNFDSAITTFRPLLFDLAGLVLIGSVVLYLSYIRYDLPWMAKFAFYGFLIGGVPLLFFVLTGYYGS